MPVLFILCLLHRIIDINHFCEHLDEKQPILGVQVERAALLRHLQHLRSWVTLVKHRANILEEGVERQVRCHTTRVALEVGHGLRVLLEAEVCVAAHQVEPAEAIFLLGAAHFFQDLLCHGKRRSRIGVKQLAARIALPFLLRTVGQRKTVAGTPLGCVCSRIAALGHQTIGSEHERQLKWRLGGSRSRKVALALAREQYEGETVHPECRLAYLKRELVGKLLRRSAL